MFRLLVSSIFCFLIVSNAYAQQQRSSGDCSPNIGKIDGDVTINCNPSLAEDIVRFQGRWSTEVAMRLSWPEGSFDLNVDPPKLEKSFFMSIGGVDHRILLTSLSEGECQGCAAHLSTFVFRKFDGWWQLTEKAIDFSRVGFRGKVHFLSEKGFSDISVVEIGPNRFGIIVPTATWYQGDTFEGMEIYSFIAGELSVVFSGVTHEYFSGIEEEEAREAGIWWMTKIELLLDKSSSRFGFYDMRGSIQSTKSKEELAVLVPFLGEKYSFPGVSKAMECAKQQHSDYANLAMC